MKHGQSTHSVERSVVFKQACEHKSCPEVTRMLKSQCQHRLDSFVTQRRLVASDGNPWRAPWRRSWTSWTKSANEGQSKWHERHHKPERPRKKATTSNWCSKFLWRRYRTKTNWEEQRSKHDPSRTLTEAYKRSSRLEDHDNVGENRPSENLAGTTH